MRTDSPEALAERAAIVAFLRGQGGISEGDPWDSGWDRACEILAAEIERAAHLPGEAR